MSGNKGRNHCFDEQRWTNKGVSLGDFGRDLSGTGCLTYTIEVGQTSSIVVLWAPRATLRSVPGLLGRAGRGRGTEAEPMTALAILALAWSLAAPPADPATLGAKREAQNSSASVASRPATPPAAPSSGSPAVARTPADRPRAAFDPAATDAMRNDAWLRDVRFVMRPTVGRSATAARSGTPPTAA